MYHNSVSIVETVRQRKGEAELAQIDWRIYFSRELPDGNACVSFVSSGDIDAIILHLFIIAHCWPRRPDGSFRNPVFVVLDKKDSQKDVCNVTGVVRASENHNKDREIGIKLAVGLSLGGNDYLPRFHNICHMIQITTLFENDVFFQNMVNCL